jgi:predicted amidohydrolase YtcJ
MRILIGLLLGAAAAAAQPAGDFVFINGRVITMDRADSVVQAVAVSNGKMVAAGNNAAVHRQAAKESATGLVTRRENLKCEMTMMAGKVVYEK